MIGNKPIPLVWASMFVGLCAGFLAGVIFAVVVRVVTQ